MQVNGEWVRARLDGVSGISICADCSDRCHVYSHCLSVALKAKADAEARNAEAYARFESAENRWDRIASGWCPTCEQAKDDVDEQYSFGAYAGLMCTACAIRKYRDGCGHLDGRQGNASELDEPMDED